MRVFHLTIRVLTDKRPHVTSAVLMYEATWSHTTGGNAANLDAEKKTVSTWDSAIRLAPSSVTVHTSTMVNLTDSRQEADRESNGDGHVELSVDNEPCPVTVDGNAPVRCVPAKDKALRISSKTRRTSHHAFSVVVHSGRQYPVVAEKALKGRGRKMDVEEVVVVDVVEISNSFLTPLVGSCNAAPTPPRYLLLFFCDDM